MPVITGQRWVSMGAGAVMNQRDSTAAKWQLDDVDLGVIAQLQEDGRRTFGRIAKAVGVSEATVRQRIQRLLDSDAMRIVAVTDPTALGVSLRATVGIRAEGELELTAQAASAIPEVDYVVVTAGSFDLLLEVLCQDTAHFHVVLDSIRRIPTVRAAESFVYLRIAKQTYPWPPASA
ncbi:MAG: Lrp/AsnC family transcriptional regulator, regulator for asnA, asnC and gidA [Solirubrobacteraceae bacterium]|jgi:Lrp/AsnC family transcriptional regulator for asnA, asnC and gidA|nr:Lrp/AsnC family transcriptional regulator, regulator for asnA, asnC and gidA [Solirubrobacteraceae bacterium]